MRDLRCCELHRCALSLEADRANPICRDALEQPRSLAKVHEGRAGKIQPSPLMPLFDADDALRVREMQWLQQHAMDDGKDGGVCGNGDRNRGDRGDGECPVLHPHADGISKVEPRSHATLDGPVRSPVSSSTTSGGPRVRHAAREHRGRSAHDGARVRRPACRGNPAPRVRFRRNRPVFGQSVELGQGKTIANWTVPRNFFGEDKS